MSSYKSTPTNFTITVAEDAPLEHEQHYECAAWWTKMKSVPGEYQLNLVQEFSNPPVLKAKIKAKVVEDFFPALWCGVSVSKKPYDTLQNAGKECEFTATFAVDAFVKDARFRADRPEIIDEYCKTALEVLEGQLMFYVGWLRERLGVEGMPKDGILDHEFVGPAKGAIDMSQRIHAVRTFRKWHENTWDYQAKAKNDPENWIHKITYWKR